MVEFQILGHLILYVLCVIVFVVKYHKEEDIGPTCVLYALSLFSPLEIIYWVLHWYFV